MDVISLCYCGLVSLWPSDLVYPISRKHVESGNVSCHPSESSCHSDCLSYLKHPGEFLNSIYLPYWFVRRPSQLELLLAWLEPGSVEAS